MFKSSVVFLVLFAHLWQVYARVPLWNGANTEDSWLTTKLKCLVYCDAVCKHGTGIAEGGPWACRCSGCLSPGQTKITLTWGHVFDLDIHVLSIPNNGSKPCRTCYYALNGCPGISQDHDNINFGPGNGTDGAEIDTLTDQALNENTVYAIGVHKYNYNDPNYHPDPNNTKFLNSGAIVSVLNGRQPGQYRFLVDPGVPVTDPNNWWFVGCVTVDSYNLFTLITPPVNQQQVFFNGLNTHEFTNLATAYCGAHPHALYPDNMITLPQKP